MKCSVLRSVCGTLALALWFLVSGMHAFVLGLATSYPDTNHRRPLKVMMLSFVFAFIFIAIIIVSILLIVFGQHLTALLARFLPVVPMYSSPARLSVIL